MLDHSLLCMGDGNCMDEVCHTYRAALGHMSKIIPICRVVAPFNKLIDMHIKTCNKSKYDCAVCSILCTILIQ